VLGGVVPVVKELRQEHVLLHVFFGEGFCRRHDMHKKDGKERERQSEK